LLRVSDNECHKKNGDHNNQERQVYEFTQKLASLLNAKLTTFSASVDTRADAFYNAISHEHYDLVVCSKLTQADLRRIPTSLLAVQRPSWPLKKILLIINGKMIEEAAVSWVIRLANKTSACITALAVVPPLPAMYQGLARMQQGLPELLSTNTELGKQTRKIAKRLVDEEINGSIKLRYGSPETQYLEEAADEHYDMIVLPAESRDRWKHWLWGELITPLLRRGGCPVLVARSM
jgi:nucleotide-binding universal stress UspA family protein